jgi:5'-deoxynucleotidase YfbR-like HD superfamily hydrolase
VEDRTVLKKKLQFMLEGSAVQRFHTRAPLRPNTVGHHSNGVALICYMIWWGDNACLPRPHLILAACTHDLAEQVTSDVSAPAKRLLDIRDILHLLENEKLADHGMDFDRYLTEEELAALRMADLFDAMLLCCQEVAAGNKMMILPYRRMREWVREVYTTLTPTMAELFMAIQEIMQEYREEPTYDCFS